VAGRHNEYKGQCPRCITSGPIIHFADTSSWICGHVEYDGVVCGHTWRQNALKARVCKKPEHESALERHFGIYGYACSICQKFSPLNPPSPKLKKKKKKKKKEEEEEEDDEKKSEKKK
jgi:hypothetical protein